MPGTTPAIEPLAVDPVFFAPTARETLSPERAARRAELITSLMQLVVVPEDAYTLEHWQLGTFNAFKPRNAWEDWLGQQVSLMMCRINRAERIERRLRDLQSLRAIDFWEEDRRVATAELAARLATDPGRTVANLLSSPAGCDWLIARWQLLADLPAEQWTEAQRTWVQLVCPVQPQVASAPGFVAARITNLIDLRERNRLADRSLRALAEADVSDEVSKPLAALRRYRATLQRQLKWFVAQLQVNPPEHRLDHRYRPDFERRLVEPYPPAADQAPAAAPTTVNETNPVPIANRAATTNPPAKSAAEPATTPVERAATRPAPDPAGTSPTRGGTKFDDRTDADKAARVEERNRRIDPARAVERQRKAARRRSA